MSLPCVFVRWTVEAGFSVRLINKALLDNGFSDRDTARGNDAVFVSIVFVRKTALYCRIIIAAPGDNKQHSGAAVTALHTKEKATIRGLGHRASPG